MEYKIKNIIKRWLGIESIEHEISAIGEVLYDREAMMNGFLLPKVQEKEFVKWAGGLRKPK